MSKFAQGLSKLKLKEVPTYVQEHAGQDSSVPHTWGTPCLSYYGQPAYSSITIVCHSSQSATTSFCSRDMYAWHTLAWVRRTCEAG